MTECSHRAQYRFRRSHRDTSDATVAKIHNTVSFLAVFLVVMTIACAIISEATAQPLSSQRWRITSVKICRSTGGGVYPSIQVFGSYPVYSFFIPRPVWTVNGTVVDAKPLYNNGRLVAFQLLDATAKLNPGAKNTVKFALPDHAGSLVFLFDQSQIPSGDCYEFF